jgi:hypothetical protein
MPGAESGLIFQNINEAEVLNFEDYRFLNTIFQFKLTPTSGMRFF